MLVVVSGMVVWECCEELVLVGGDDGVSMSGVWDCMELALGADRERDVGGDRVCMG